MNRAAFFEQIIDGYLFHDLANMAEVQQKENEQAGAASYPMLATCVSGLELLGGLLYKRDYTAADNWIYFEYYWDNYLVKVAPSYTDYSYLFWKLVRNGVSHTYMAKVGISVTKGNKEGHLAFNADKTRFNIDCIAFYEDLKRSYTELVKPLLDPTDEFTAQIDNNIAAMLVESDELCNEVLAPFKATGSKTSDLSVPPSMTTPSGITTTMTTKMSDDFKQKMRKAHEQAISSHTRYASGATLMTQEAFENLKKSEQERAEQQDFDQ